MIAGTILMTPNVVCDFVLWKKQKLQAPIQKIKWYNSTLEITRLKLKELPFLEDSANSEAWSKENHVPQENGGSIELATDYVKPTDSRTVNGMKKQKIQQNEIQYHQKVKMVKRETLEDLILASPTRKEKCVRTDAATIQRSFVIRFFKRICPPFTDDYGVTNVSRFNVHNGSMESVVNVKVVDHIGRTNDAPLSRCKSRNINKKVSFRVPSEDDIIIFYDSNEESEN